jgi:hypothetical protein
MASGDSSARFKGALRALPPTLLIIFLLITGFDLMCDTRMPNPFLSSTTPTLAGCNVQLRDLNERFDQIVADLAATDYYQLIEQRQRANGMVVGYEQQIQAAVILFGTDSPRKGTGISAHTLFGGETEQAAGTDVDSPNSLFGASEEPTNTPVLFGVSASKESAATVVGSLFGAPREDAQGEKEEETSTQPEEHEVGEAQAQKEKVEEQAKHEVDEKAAKQAEEKAAKEAEELARYEAAKKEAEEEAKKEAEEKAALEATAAAEAEAAAEAAAEAEAKAEAEAEAASEAAAKVAKATAAEAAKATAAESEAEAAAAPPLPLPSDTDTTALRVRQQSSQSMDWGTPPDSPPMSDDEGDGADGADGVGAGVLVEDTATEEEEEAVAPTLSSLREALELEKRRIAEQNAKLLDRAKQV